MLIIGVSVRTDYMQCALHQVLNVVVVTPSNYWIPEAFTVVQC